METQGKLNQFGDYEDTTHMSVNDWEDRWNKSQTQFHVNRTHPMLEKHYTDLTGGNSSLRIFLPLCGKTLDLKWLADKGHDVVGCEGVDLACREFFEEHEIPYTSEPLNEINGVVYKATDGRKLTIYRCDYFHLTSDLIGTFDCVWDRGSFAAIGTDKRQEYVNVTIPLLQKNTKYLLDCFLVDNSIFGGPPFNCTESEVTKYFGNKCLSQKIDTRDVFSKWQESWGIKSFVEEVHMLTLK